MDKKYLEEIKEIEKKYLAIAQDINLNFVKCINIQSEKKKFFKALIDDKIYNPQFKFEKEFIEKEKIIKLEKLYEEINLNNDIYNLKKIYKDKIKDIIYNIKYKNLWGDQKSTKYAIKSYGKPNILLYLKAKKYCKNFQREIVKFKRISPKKIGEELKEYVKELTNNNINLEFIELSNKLNIEPNQNLIQINPKEKFTSLDLERLKAHEIGGHYLRYYNGTKTKFYVFRVGTKNYLETEEGIAVYLEDISNVLSKAQMFVYAGRVIATYLCTKKSFYQIFKKLKSLGFKDRTAFAITLRAKRNLYDTSKKGGFTKDYVYFSGYLKVKKFTLANSINELMHGKYSINDYYKIKDFLKNENIKIKTINN